jgi:hypothetical protein
MIDDSALLHAGTYDPVKAHEYYLRTRKLKGRNGGVQTGPVGDQRQGGGPKTSGQSPARSNKSGGGGSGPVKIAAARQAALEKRLDVLRTALSKLVAQAKKESGAESSSSTSKTSSSSKSGGGSTTKSDSKPLTAEEKRKNKERYEKYKKEEPAKTKDKPEPKSTDEKIAELRAKIADVRVQLQQAIEEARRKSNSQTASKGR